jgi:hypothetical protein
LLVFHLFETQRDELEKRLYARIIFLPFASFCNPEIIASENNVRVKDLRTVGKVMAERTSGDGESEKVNAILRGAQLHNAVTWK